MVDAILKLKDGKTLADAAAEALAVLGAGGDPNAQSPENFLGFVNTPVQEGYTRVRCTEAYAQALEYIKDGETCGLVVVLWPGVEEPVLSLPDDASLGRIL
jgi:hypothetical protein